MIALVALTIISKESKWRWKLVIRKTSVKLVHANVLMCRKKYSFRNFSIKRFSVCFRVSGKVICVGLVRNL